MSLIDGNPNRTFEEAFKEVMGYPPPALPDVSIPVPNRGYGPRFGTQADPDTEWGGKIPAFDTSIKGEGYYGRLPRLDGSGEYSTELSIGTEINGRRYHIPSMVPGLTLDEMRYLLSTPENDLFTKSPKMMQSIQDKATRFAQMRLERGLPTYATAPEEGAYASQVSKIWDY